MHSKLLLNLDKLKRSYKFNRIIRNNRKVIRLIDQVGKKIEGPLNSPSSIFNLLVGQYIFRINESKEYKICIEMADGGTVVSEELLNWCDIYFKANLWKSKKYPEKVKPMYYPNPRIISDIDKLAKYRRHKKLYDICFIVNVRGGIDDGSMGIEHNLRLIEEISKVKCKKFIYAIVMLGDKQKIVKRLEKQKIPYSTKFMKIKDLWKIHAQSHLSFIRLGMHFCIPWRMQDLIAMGACPAFDSTPYSVWPVPLVENQNYLSLNLNWNPTKPVATEEEYETIPDLIYSMLYDQERIEQISKNNSLYFDNYLEPVKIGEYIIKTVESMKMI